MITHLEPDILECEVKWALGSITTNKANGGDGILVELFQILKDDDVKVLHSMCQQIWKTQQWPQDWKKVSFHSNPKERQDQRMLKLLNNCIHLTRSKFSKSGYNNMLTMNFQMFKLILERAEEQDIKLPTSARSSKKQEGSRKTSTSALLTVPKPLTVWITTNCSKVLKRWAHQST